MRICVVGDYDGRYSKYWGNLGEIGDERDFLNNPTAYGLVGFCGGEDITPSLYGHRNLCSGNDPRRDEREVEFFRRAEENSIPMSGICRGAQFLNVMCGGTMIQDVPSHGGFKHLCLTTDGEAFEVTSSHHQMIVPHPDAQILGWAQQLVIKNRCRYDGVLPDHVLDPEDPSLVRVTEAWAIPERRIFACQFHAEWMRPEDRAWTWQLEMTEKICFGAKKSVTA